MVVVRTRTPAAENQPQVLREMGELRADELAKWMQWWRMDYEDACEVFTVGSFGTVKRTPAERQAYLDSHNVPHDLVEQWDAETEAAKRKAVGK
jgi:hypothetical protein